jgi:hypothetical protein
MQLDIKNVKISGPNIKEQSGETLPLSVALAKMDDYYRYCARVSSRSMKKEFRK